MPVPIHANADDRLPRLGRDSDQSALKSSFPNNVARLGRGRARGSGTQLRTSIHRRRYRHPYYPAFRPALGIKSNWIGHRHILAVALPARSRVLPPCFSNSRSTRCFQRFSKAVVRIPIWRCCIELDHATHGPFRIPRLAIEFSVIPAFDFRDDVVLRGLQASK